MHTYKYREKSKRILPICTSSTQIVTSNDIIIIIKKQKHTLTFGLRLYFFFSRYKIDPNYTQYIKPRTVRLLRANSYVCTKYLLAIFMVTSKMNWSRETRKVHGFSTSIIPQIITVKKCQWGTTYYSYIRTQKPQIFRKSFLYYLGILLQAVINALRSAFS